MRTPATVLTATRCDGAARFDGACRRRRTAPVLGDVRSQLSRHRRRHDHVHFLARSRTGRYIYETHANPSTLARLFVSQAAVERSVMEIDAAGTRPIDWQLDDGKSGKDDDGELHFDWSRNTVTGTVEGEPVEARGRARRAGPLVDADRRHDGAAARRGARHDRADRRQPHQALHVHEEGAGGVDSALGKLDTVIYESTREGGSSRTSRFWMAPSLEFLPVRAEQIRKGKVETVMVLQKVDRP